MKRRGLLGFVAGAATTWPLVAQSQPGPKKLQVAFLYTGPKAAATPRIRAVTTGLQSSGLRLQDQVSIVPGLTDGNIELLPSTVAELVARPVDIILAIGPAAVRAARAGTSTVPIVALDLESDPVASGFITSLARPGGNVTGLFLDFPEFSQKWVELLKETVPSISNVAVFWDPASGPFQLQAAEAAAKSFNLSAIVQKVSTRADIERAFQAATAQRTDAVLILPSPFVGGNTKMLSELTAAHRLPAVTLFTDFAREGGLLAYGPNLLTAYRQQGVMVAKLLRGASAAETPVERPTKFELVLNLKAADSLGITVPSLILLRADEVID
ncbi:MAG TPA: ABC transporter substrate-binding protein [Vineibacter sp.]|nr:ABC transporter substrate-binding protein [Vineibacter sp.]